MTQSMQTCMFQVHVMLAFGTRCRHTWQHQALHRTKTAFALQRFEVHGTMSAHLFHASDERLPRQQGQLLHQPAN